MENVFVIVVGNVTVGGVGKTPFVMHLAKKALKHGLKVGIVSRGYKRQSSGLIEVKADSSVNEVGDEVLMLKQNIDCPVAVSEDRYDAATYLHDKYQLDVILSDDGLQHYNLPRDYGIIVIDGKREFGNTRLLPAGPLREPISRIKSADLVVCNGVNKSYENQFWPYFDYAVSIENGKKRALESFQMNRVHGVAGIGNPKRFFDMLADKGIQVIEHSFPDHHFFQNSDLNFDDELPILMTEKDMIKCRELDKSNLWYVPVHLELNSQLHNKINHLIEEIQ